MNVNVNDLFAIVTDTGKLSGTAVATESGYRYTCEDFTLKSEITQHATGVISRKDTCQR